MDGKIIAGRYEIVRRIGAGGSARVYLAHDLVLKRDVAVKILHEEEAQDPSFVKRFQREAQSAARLNHPNIVAIYDWGSVDGTYYMVMEAVTGGNLKEEIARRGALPEDEALSIAEQVAAALEAAHTHGVIHRDVKPQNVLLTDTGRVKVADFGIARATGLTQLTATNMVAGTASYLSPEQARGTAVDERSDVYSLGVLLWELLTGRELFGGSSMVEVALRHVNEIPPPLRQVRPSISPLTEAIVARALAKDPERRYQSAAAMHRALAEAREALRAPAIEPLPLMTQQTVQAAVPPARTTRSTAVPERSGQRQQPRGTAPSQRWLAALLALVLLIAGAGGILAEQHGTFFASSGTHPTATVQARLVATKPRTHPTATPTPPPPTPTPTPVPTKRPAAHPVAHPRPTNTPTPVPATPTSTPSPLPAATSAPPSTSSLAANAPQGAVAAFYRLVSTHQFQQAAQLWTPSMRAQYPPASNINGRFANTRRIEIIQLKVLNQTATSATVQVDFVEQDGTRTQQLAGTWNVVKSRNGWLLNYPNF